MVGPTLIDIRDRVERLAAEDGRYYLRCGRTGDRPVPAAGNRFPDRATARAAARATEQYRSALRRYDPQVHYYDLIVCEETGRDATVAHHRGPAVDGRQRRPSEPVISDSSASERRDLVEFCHRVVGTVFETLSEAGHDGVESAVMDAYFGLAETVGDPDELCLCLLESLAGELDDRLSAADQATVLADAAARLASPGGDGDPLDATLAAVERRGIIEGYARSPYSIGLDDGAGSVAVWISGYALSARESRLPVLPLAFELSRRYGECPPWSVRATPVDGGWRLTFVLADVAERNSVVSVPIDGGE